MYRVQFVFVVFRIRGAAYVSDVRMSVLYMFILVCFVTCVFPV